MVAVLAGWLALSGLIAGCTRRAAAPGAAGSTAAASPETVPRYPARSLAPARGALFGAWVQPVNLSVVNPKQSAVASFERTIGRKLAIDQLYTAWAAPMPVEYAVARWDLRHGTIPMISWAVARTDLIAAGRYDSLIRARARELKSLHGPVMLRWFWEMTLRTNRRYAVSPASYVAAWRHMHAIFVAAGATNVRWIWCPSIKAFVQGVAQAYYPGQSYVDWVGADGYNWASNVLPWRSFAQIFEPFYRWGLPTGKPMLIGEYGTVEGAPGAKAAWFRQADREIKTQFPALRAVVYFNSFNSNHPKFGNYFNWRVTSSKSALAAFKAFANDHYFEARPTT
jgi:hypothetical protein